MRCAAVGTRGVAWRCAGEGNKSPTLRFDTVWSGELTVSPCGDGTFIMGLPRYELTADVPAGAGADSALMRVTLMGLPEADLLLSHGAPQALTDGGAGGRGRQRARQGGHVLQGATPVLARPGQDSAARQPEARHAACGVCTHCQVAGKCGGQSAKPAWPSPRRCAQALIYLVVVLHAHAGRGALEALRPDTARLRQAYTGGEIMSIIVTAQGVNGGYKCLWLHSLL